MWRGGGGRELSRGIGGADGQKDHVAVGWLRRFLPGSARTITVPAVRLRMRANPSTEPGRGAHFGGVVVARIVGTDLGSDLPVGCVTPAVSFRAAPRRNNLRERSSGVVSLKRRAPAPGIVESRNRRLIAPVENDPAHARPVNREQRPGRVPPSGPNLATASLSD
jgi:hypothetical protein